MIWEQSSHFDAQRALVPTSNKLLTVHQMNYELGIFQKLKQKALKIPSFSAGEHI